MSEMNEMPTHPMESAIVDALTQGLEALPVSLPPESEVLAAAGEPGAPAPSPAAVAGVAEVMGPETAAGHGFRGLFSRRWTYVAVAVLVLAAMIGIVAGMEFHQGASGSSASNSRPPAPAPSGGGSQAVGGVPSSTPLATATPNDTPVPAAVATPPSTPVPAATQPPSTPVPTPPPTPAQASSPPPAPTSPVQPSTPTPAPATAPPATTPPSATPTPCPVRLLHICV